MIEWAIDVNQGLPPLATDVLKLRHEPFEVARRQGQQQPVSGPVREAQSSRLNGPARDGLQGKLPPAGRLSTRSSPH